MDKEVTHRVEVDTDGTISVLKIDGIDLSSLITSAVIVLKAGAPARIHLELLPRSVTFDGRVDDTLLQIKKAVDER